MFRNEIVRVFEDCRSRLGLTKTAFSRDIAENPQFMARLEGGVASQRVIERAFDNMPGVKVSITVSLPEDRQDEAA
jgi:hypothetical protein